ncbi:MAG: MFS transporter [Actinomycetota bacterium]|nr:MFS transporter [Actinomycetota bacterium]
MSIESTATGDAGTQAPETSRRYQLMVLSNTTLGVFMAFLNSSIVIIALPAIFRGINLNPLAPSNVGYLLWILLGFSVASAVLVVSLGRLGDLLGRVRLYNFGFLVFTLGSLALALTPGKGSSAAAFIVAMRIVQGVGGALLFANSNAILADAFPPARRGMALGINQVAGLSGAFLGLIVGGVLADINWRLVFAISVPFGAFGTIWAYFKLVSVAPRKHAKIDYLGSSVFAAGLVLILIAITYGTQPSPGHSMSWTTPAIMAEGLGGLALLIAFFVIERHVAEPMLDVRLFRLRAFAAGNFANLLASIGRGGLQFMLILWLQGIWLPLHGYDFAQTPLWAGIYMLPLTVGFLLAGPASGYLSDRYGARAFSTLGMAVAATSFLLLLAVPVNFSYWFFAPVIFLNGIGFGLFAAPNTTAVMNSVPARSRGTASGVLATLTNTGQVLSIGVFFSLMIVGLSATLQGHRLGGACHAHQHRPGAFDRCLLLAHDRWSERHAPGAALWRADQGGSARRPGQYGRAPARGCQPFRRIPRLQSDQGAAGQFALEAPGAFRGPADLEVLLPEPHIGSLQARDRDRLHRGRHPLHRSRNRFRAAGAPLRSSSGGRDPCRRRTACRR